MITTTTRTTTRLGALLLGLLGCAPTSGTPPASPAAAEVPVDPSFPVRWSLAREGEALRVRWTVQNQSGADAWLLDGPWLPQGAGYAAHADRMFVMQSASRDEVLLIRGHVRPPPGQGVAVEYTPVARPLPAGASLEGEAALRLPLSAWHAFYVLPPLQAAPRRATLQVGVLQGDPPEGVPAWETRYKDIATGDPLQVPTLGYVVQRGRLVSGETLPIP